MDEVHVVRGVAAADAWLRYCNVGYISDARAKGLHEILRSHQAMRNAHVGAKTPQALGAPGPRVRVGLALARVDAKAAGRRG